MPFQSHVPQSLRKPHCCQPGRGGGWPNSHSIPRYSALHTTHLAGFWCICCGLWTQMLKISWVSYSFIFLITKSLIVNVFCKLQDRAAYSQPFDGQDDYTGDRLRQEAEPGGDGRSRDRRGHLMDLSRHGNTAGTIDSLLPVIIYDVIVSVLLEWSMFATLLTLSNVKEALQHKT